MRGGAGLEMALVVAEHFASRAPARLYMHFRLSPTGEREGFDGKVLKKVIKLISYLVLD